MHDKILEIGVGHCFLFEAFVSGINHDLINSLDDEKGEPQWNYIDILISLEVSQAIMFSIPSKLLFFHL